MTESYYPESPKIDKSDLIKVKGKYRSQVIINLFAILLFFVLFFAMIAAAAWVIDFTISYPFRTNWNKWDVFLKIGLVAMSIMMFVFLLKFLFKKHNTETPLNIEIKEQDHPKLFEFIRVLSKEIGAPFPKKVFVNHEINAAVFYNSTVLSLFLPVRKNLLIGLGLVNSVTLDEFKAILAHEFGHFSQSSMKLGSYIYMANNIIYDMVHERDRWDKLLENWKTLDFRISIFAWLLTPIIWLIRLFMNTLSRGLTLLYSSLSRQMEYHADLVAVSVTGSNSIINGLYKIGLTNQSFNFTFGQLQVANDQNIFSEDIFYNHRKCHEYLEENNESFREASFSKKVKNPNTKYQLFDKEDGIGSTMYASHPPDFKREENAKARFIEGIVDNRSAWELFSDPTLLAKKVTKNLYKISLEKETINFSDSKTVQNFILNELSEITYNTRYKGFFEQRAFFVPKESEYETLLKKHNISEKSIKSRLSGLWGNTFIERMDEVLKKNAHTGEIIKLSQSNDKKTTIEINGNSYSQNEVVKAHEDLQKWIQEDDDWFKEKSEEIFTIYSYINQKLNPDDKSLQMRYMFLASTNVLNKKLVEIQDEVEKTIQELIDKGQIEEAEINIYADRFFKQKLALEDLARKANTVSLPSFGKDGEIDKLGEYLTRGKVAFLPINNLDYEKIQAFREQVQVVGERLNRLSDKNLGHILKYQEELEEKMFDETISNGSD